MIETGQQQATHEALHDGWYHIGDTVRLVADGYFWIQDRKKTPISSGGGNIYSAEVERVLKEQPDVLECAIIGRPDPRWGEVPVAYVIRRSGAQVGAAAFMAHLQSQLARFETPHEIIFTYELPGTALGKIHRVMTIALPCAGELASSPRQIPSNHARCCDRFVAGMARQIPPDAPGAR